VLLTARKVCEKLSTPKIVACIPAYNEEATIAKVVIRALKYVDNVIVCDDGSSDDTGSIAKGVGAVLVRHLKNEGKGTSFRDMFDVASKLKAEVVVTLDADGQHDPDEIPGVIEPIMNGKADVVIGMRFGNGKPMPRLRIMGNRLLTAVTNIGTGSRVLDSQSGYRAYSMAALKKLEVTEKGIGVESQILREAFSKHLRILEVPISTSYDGVPHTYNFLAHALRVLVAIIRYVSERHPLVIIGVPGMLVMTIGLYYGFLLLKIYFSTGVFAIGYALLAIGGTLTGIVAIFASIVLYAIGTFYQKLKQQIDYLKNARA
jgi:glycosyltransferase involved in cell wall biosynthesis